MLVNILNYAMADMKYEPYALWALIKKKMTEPYGRFNLFF